MWPTVSSVRAAEYFVVVMTTVDERRLRMRTSVESIDVIVEIREEEGDILEERGTHIRSNNVGGMHPFQRSVDKGSTLAKSHVWRMYKRSTLNLRYFSMYKFFIKFSFFLGMEVSMLF